MGQFLRDEKLQNLRLSEDRLRKIYGDLKEITDQYNKSAGKTELIQFHIIRFDNKGFRLIDFDDVMKYYNDAHRVERIIFYVYSDTAWKSSNVSRKAIELNLDTLQPDKCGLIVQDDDQNWVDATFWKLKERLDRYHNKNYLIRNRWAGAIVQFIGVFVGIVFSLWLGNKLASILTIQNPFAFGFIIAFLIFSNIWTYLYREIGNLLYRIFPNITFTEKVSWIGALQGLTYTFLVSVFIIAINRILIFVSGVIKSIIK